ncbi:MAG: energy transducer TonB [Bacteroidales bacterium]|nr:energy transducer TonB [Bacteroidales bacterium]
MKKIYAVAMIAACAMMVFSCKNEGKGSDDVKDAANEAVEAVEGAAQEGIEAVEGAAQAAGEAVEGAIERADEALEKLEGIEPYATVEAKPTFNGGDADSFRKYVQENIQYPQNALENDVQGNVTVAFVVDANGKIRNAQVVKGVDSELDTEALRVVANAPAWAPAKKNGKNVPVSCTIPVTFKIVK